MVFGVLHPIVLLRYDFRWSRILDWLEDNFDGRIDVNNDDVALFTIDMVLDTIIYKCTNCNVDIISIPKCNVQKFPSHNNSL